MSDRTKCKSYGLLSSVVLTAGLMIGMPHWIEAKAQTGGKTQQAAALQEAKRLNEQVEQLYKQENYEEATPLAERALQIRETILGANHPDVAISLNRLANLYREQAEYTKAELLYQRALRIREIALGKDHSEVAITLGDLAGLHIAQGEDGKAELLLIRALRIIGAKQSKNYLNIVKPLGDLAVRYAIQGESGKAAFFYQGAIRILETTSIKDQPEVGDIFIDLAFLYLADTEFDKAELLLQRSLQIQENALGKNHPNIVNSLDALAGLYTFQGEYGKAIVVSERTLRIREIILGKDHPEVASNLNYLAELHVTRKEYSKAESLYQRALQIFETTSERDDSEFVINLNGQADLYREQKEYSKAESLYQRALQIFETTLGKDARGADVTLRGLALLYLAQGNLSRATELFDRSLNTEEKEIISYLAGASEEDKQYNLDTISRTMDGLLSLVFQDNSRSSKVDRLALTAIFRRKGRVLDAVSADVQTLLGQQANNPQAQKLFNEWRDILTKQSVLIYRGLSSQPPDQYKIYFNQLENKRNRIEAEISLLSNEFRQNTQPVELTTVQQQIPTDAVLIEIVQYQPYNPKAKVGEHWDNPHYAAYVLTSTGDPKGIDLGEAAQIESAIEIFRAAITDSNTSLEQVQQSGRNLEQLIIQPVRKLLGNKRQILISPDGEFNRISFEALVNTEGKYLIEEFDFSYLTSGRDLLKFSTVVSHQPALILGGINYTQTPIAGRSAGTITLSSDLIPQTQSKMTQRSRSFTNQTFTFLTGTKIEAEAIQSLFPNAVLLTDRAATETALKQVNAPLILHLATHAFFQLNPDLKFSNLPISALQRKHGSVTLNLNNPLLRSGLALAGANVRGNRSDLDDGILTAQELTTLNLHSTQLVVLSACDTGVGNIRIGEGVYGLRRALVIAGSQTQIISLWKVSDEQTQGLMIKYYQNLKAGQGRHAALKSAQLALLQDPKTQHPYYWAAFLPSGNWTPLKHTPSSNSKFKPE